MERTVQKNATEVVKVGWSTFGGHLNLDVRVYAGSGDAEKVPTRKGLSASAEVWRELLPLIAAELEAGQ